MKRTCSIELPPASRIAWMDRSTTRACIPMSSSTNWPVRGSRAVIPAVKMRLPNFTPCEMGKRELAAWSVRMIARTFAISDVLRGSLTGFRSDPSPGGIVETGEERDHVLTRIDRDELPDAGD